MGVTVQVMVDAAVSGVMFTCNPLTGDPSTVAVNASWGLGLAVVGGEVTPDEYRISKVTGELLHRTIGPKLIEYGPDAERSDVPPERQDVACLDEQQLGRAARARAAGGAPLRRTSGRRVGDRRRRRAVRTAVAAGDRGTAERGRGQGKSAMDLVMGTFGVGKKD